MQFGRTDRCEIPLWAFRILGNKSRFTTHGEEHILFFESLFDPLRYLFWILLRHEAQLQLGFKRSRNLFLPEIAAFDRRNIRERNPDRGRNEPMIAKGAVGGVNTDPTGARQEDLDPGVESAIRPAIGNIQLEIAKKSADESHRESLFSHDGGAEQRGITARARSKFESFGR